MSDTVDEGTIQDLRCYIATLEAERDRLCAEAAKWNRAAERLEAALLKIRDYMPEQIPRLPDGWNDGCEECKEASKRKWPPSGLCNKHYSQADDLARSVELLENTQHYMMRKIAGDALKGSAPQAQEEDVCEFCGDKHCTFHNPRCIKHQERIAKAIANGMPPSGRHG